MLQDDFVELIGEVLAERFTEANTHFLELLGRQIKEIGSLSPTGLHQLQQMMRMGANIETIQQELALATGQTAEDVAKLLEAAAESAYADTAPFYEARSMSRQPLAKNVTLRNAVTAIEKVTLEELVNLSQTTVVRDVYSAAIDKAVWALQTGQADYHKAIRSALRETAKTGLRVEYESGHTRRLDSAVRQNVLDGTRAINQGVRDEAGRQFGADGVEISAHGHCAEDHEPYQGKQMSFEAFEKLQNSLRRRLGIWNCAHRWFSIILGASPPANSRKDLAAMKRENHKGVDYKGKHWDTIYLARQEQRNMETAIRYAEDIKTLAEASGDTEWVREMTDPNNPYSIPNLNREYREFSKAAGLQTRRDRIRDARQRYTA